MIERPAINASPLILLTKAGLLDLLQSVSQEVVVPSAVAMEIQQYGARDITARAIALTNWLIIVDTPPVPEPIQSWDLGPGESAVLTWGYVHPNTEIIVDDLAARRGCVATPD